MAQQKRPQRPVYPQEERTAKRMPQRPVYSGEYPPPHQRRKAPTRVDYSGISPIITRRKEPQAAPFVNHLRPLRCLAGKRVPARRRPRSSALPAQAQRSRRQLPRGGSQSGSAPGMMMRPHRRALSRMPLYMTKTPAALRHGMTARHRKKDAGANVRLHQGRKGCAAF